MFDECGYEDGHSRLDLCLLGAHVIITLPFVSKKLPYGDCDAPRWGIEICDKMVRVEWGGQGNWGHNRSKSWEIPFINWTHVRHQVECCDEYGEPYMMDYDILSKMTIDNGEGVQVPMSLEDNPLVNKYCTTYIDKYDGEEISCVYWVEEREWRRKWLTKYRLFRMVRKYIEIEFGSEVGKKKGSWKGGCMGCSYDLKLGETPQQCIKRMEQEREF